MDLIAQVKKNIQEKNLVPLGGSLLAGVSGGSDSMALLHVLGCIRYEYGLRVRVVHFNHQLRLDAGKDQSLVENFCQQNQIACQSFPLKVRRTKDQSSVEDCARQLRLEKFLSLSKKWGTQTIALAHHRDDCAETVLMRILRGTGLQGLQGILPRKKIGSLTLVRPFFNVSKTAVLAHIKKHKIPFRDDPSNRSMEFFRNRVRLKLLPYLEKNYQTNIRELLFQLASLSAEDYQFLLECANDQFKKILRSKTTRRHIKLDLQAFRDLHPCLQKMVTRLACERIQGDLNRLSLKHFAEIEDLICHRPARSCVDLPKGLTVTKTTAYIIFQQRNP